MNARLHDGSMQDVLVESTQSDGQLRDSSDENHSLLAEDPLTGLPWTETLLPLITSWAGSSAIHAICLHFVGLGILANIPELQSSHSLLKEATDRLAPMIEDHDRLTRFSGNKLLVFSKRSEADLRQFLVEASDRLESFGMEAEGRHLPEIRIGMATLENKGRSTVTVEAVNTLLNDAVNVTVPLAEVVVPRHDRAESAPAPSLESAPPSEQEPASDPSFAPAPRAATLPPGPRPDTLVPPDDPAPREMFEPPTAMEQDLPAEGGAAPHVSHHNPIKTEEETTMITRGHLERTPIRHMAEASASDAGREPAASHHRLVLKGVDVVVTGLVATAVVDLDFEGRKVRGKAIGRSADSQHSGLIAEALGRAVTDLLPAGHGVVFKQAVPASTDAGDVVVTVVELLTPVRAEVLFGVAPTESEPVAGVARSVLNAVNHSIAHLLAPIE